MDPTLNHITPHSSFDNNDNAEGYTLEMYNNPNRLGFISVIDRKVRYADTNPPSEYITLTIRKSLDKVKRGYNKFDPVTWNKLRKEANPFELNGSSIFINRAAVKLANIDAIYGLTPNFTNSYADDFVAKAPGLPIGKWTFADVAGGPGSFSQYIMFRMPESVGYGITLADPKDVSLGWNPEIAKRINVIVGDDGTGDLFKHASYFSDRVLEEEEEGVDLVVADGAIGGNEENPKQEIDNFGLVVAELITVLSCVKLGGKFICKIFEAETKATAQLLYLLSLNFEFIDICKPIASRPANSERYLIGINKIHSSFDLVKYLKDVLNVVNKDKSKKITRIITNNLPGDFGRWLTKKNDIHANLQLTVGHYIEQVSKGNKGIVPKYNMYKAYSLWNIPDNRTDSYNIVHKNKGYYKNNMDRVEDIDTLIYKELQRYMNVNKLTYKISDQLNKYYNSGNNLSNAGKFLSIYLLDHLTKNEFHPLDPVFPSGSFQPDERYYDHLYNLSSGSVTRELSKQWFVSLGMKDQMKDFAMRMSTFPNSKYRYNIRKETTDKGVKYSYTGTDKKKKGFMITNIMDIKLNELLKPEYQSRNKEYIYLLLLRYFGVLNSGNHQLGIPDYEVIVRIFNIKEELFASPFNCSIVDGYHSAFPDTDKQFGSLGKFVDTQPISGFGYSVNPPYTDIVMQLAMEKVVSWLIEVPEILFYISIPVWDKEQQLELGFDIGNLYQGYPALEVLVKSGFIKAKRAFHRDNFVYKDHNTGNLINAANTYIIIASNRDLTSEETEYMTER